MKENEQVTRKEVVLSLKEQDKINEALMGGLKKLDQGVRALEGILEKDRQDNEQVTRNEISDLMEIQAKINEKLSEGIKRLSESTFDLLSIVNELKRKINQ